MTSRSMTTLGSPLGPLTLVATEEALVGLWFEGRAPWEQEAVPRRTPLLDRAVEELRAYLAGELQAFEVPVAPQGTPFQQEVWAALRTIPFGATWSYARLARAIGRPAAVRAVGAANGQNPIALIIPCHRVIGADGTLTGYAGGLPRKQWLLAHEGVELALAIPG
jgi:methylated-DNA-[protein]-cysteine S-methyltransferase